MVVALLTATLRPSKAPVPPERGVKWTDAAAPPTKPDPWITRVVSCPAFACAGWTPESDADAAAEGLGLASPLPRSSRPGGWVAHGRAVPGSSWTEIRC